MKLPISQLLPPTAGAEVGRRRGLVIGAGGTAKAACFALLDLGLEVLVYNRSPDKGIDLAERFNGTFVADLSSMSLADAASIAVVVSTVPAAAGFTLPAAITQYNPIVLDVVYKPVRTPLILQV